MKDQKTWLITGASLGLGLEITKAVLVAGDKVIGTARKKPEEFAAQLNNENLTMISLDVTNEEQVIDEITRLMSDGKRIDVLVNNAGVGLLGAIEETSDKEVRQNFETNVFGLLNVTRSLLPYLRKQRSGHIINFSSVGGLSGSAGWGIYNSTKFAVEGISEALFKELAPMNIFVTAVEPGYFRTNFLDSSSLNRVKNIIENYSGTVGLMRERVSAVNNNQPGDPEKLAQALVKIAHNKCPPLHLPLGKDSLNAYRAKSANFELDINEWMDTIINTDHDDVKN